MKTSNSYFRKVMFMAFLIMSALRLYGQDNRESESMEVHLDTVTLEGDYVSFKKMVSVIVAKQDFKYRKALRRAKASKKQYVFSDLTISEVEILKHLKKAARKSESPQAFKTYFYDKEFYFIEVLDNKTMATLYSKIRATTLKGYLEELDAFFG
ncbi:MAG TPA: hypothetical protein VK010_06020 [Flavobacteriaceae bacterium]|nr:hypothetical protein [Flavobacteriaceae bacterium]